jgi:hypothetical protein
VLRDLDLAQGDRPIRTHSFLTGTCPFVTVRTARPLAPLIAQHNCGTPIYEGYWSLGERDGHMVLPLFHRPTYLFKKNGPGLVHGPCPNLG